MELARTTDDSRADVRALREECDLAAVALEVMTGQSRTAVREALEEALAGARQLRHEIESARTVAAESHRTPDPDGARAPGARPVPPGEDRKNHFGVTVAPGVVIAAVAPDGPADAAGLTRGDVIEEANGRAVRSGSELHDAVASVRAGERHDRPIPPRRGTARSHTPPR